MVLNYIDAHIVRLALLFQSVQEREDEIVFWVDSLSLRTSPL
jgi:hypothetical protein